MAEGGDISCGSGSDFIYDFYCELCFEDGKRLDAHGYCTNCKEYLCEECYHGHRMTRLSRHHVLMDNSNMPKHTPLPSDTVSKMISRMCKSHTGEIVKFYCKYHGVFGCSTCFATEHRSCPDVESILEKSENILESQKYTSFITKLKSMMTETEVMLKLSRDNITLVRMRCSDAVCVVRQVKEEAVFILEEIESNYVKLAETLCSECEEQMENLTEEFSDLSERIESIKSEVESLFSSKRVCQLYIKMKEAEKDVISLQDNLSNAERKNVVKTFTFEPNLELNSYLKTVDILGRILYQDKGAINISPCSSDEPSISRATKVAEINVNSSYETYTCSISGSAVLSQNRMIIIDCNNNTVKLVDSSANTVISKLKVSSQPWDVAMISQTKAAVTVPYRNKILLLSVVDKLGIERELAVHGRCRGIAYNQNRLFVTYYNNPRLEIMDLRGYVIKTIEHDGDGCKLFVCPLYVCISRDGKTVYVSNDTRGTVTRLTCEGVVMSVYTDVDLKGPEKVCTDHYGNVYVCGFMKNNVHMITADCKKVKVILTQADGLDSWVRSVSHCQDTNRLFVGMEDNKIKVYQLS